MKSTAKHTIEMYYTLTCPNCKVLERMLKEVWPEFEADFAFKKTLASSPLNYIKTLRLGIHSVPVLLIDNDIVFRSVPERAELIETLTLYKQKNN